MSASPPEDPPDPSVPPNRDATFLLARMEGGDSAAAQELLPLVYEQLRSAAGRLFRGDGGDHTLQPTALVHEAYLKLARTPGGSWTGRAHFCAVAALAMRQILRDHARAKRALKRDGGARAPRELTASPVTGHFVDLLVLEETLTRLAEVDERGAQVVDLRFFGGLTGGETADYLGISRATEERIWRRSSAWLRVQLGDAEPTP